MKNTQISKTCELCGGEFQTPRSYAQKRFCSRKCYLDAPVSERKFNLISCPSCGSEFQPKGSARPQYCSEDCRNPMIRCGNPKCDKPFRPNQRGYQKYCSRDCKKEVRWGGLSLDEKGYVRRWVGPRWPGSDGRGRIKEHRYQMQLKLGRTLEPSETVHHINGNRQNNEWSNLELRQGAHGKGQVIRCLDCGSHNVGAMTISYE